MKQEKKQRAIFIIVILEGVQNLQGFFFGKRQKKLPPRREYRNKFLRHKALL